MMIIQACTMVHTANSTKHVLDILAEMIALDQSGFKSSSRGPSAAAEFEDDV
jgi:hypothetical protein